MAESHYKKSAGGKSAAKPLGNHQASWIWGRHLVQETLQSRCWPILELWLADDLPEADVAAMHELASQADVPVERAARHTLVSRCRGEDHQGFAARMAEFPYQTPEAVFSKASPWPLYVALDRIQDPFNFGAMLRSAEIFDAAGVIIGSREQVGVTSQVARSSVGAVNRLPIARVPDLAEFLGSLQESPPMIVSASEKATTTISEFDFCRPTLLVIGNEGRGVSEEVARHCQATVRIPQQGTLNSLNAAAALAIICYEARRQQGLK
ncbi:MAG: 23S rRNA (guanosine(2251)-2'-O)-methyltransferase RlmB [Planctomycetota bacterium]